MKIRDIGLALALTTLPPLPPEHNSHPAQEAPTVEQITIAEISPTLEEESYVTDSEEARREIREYIQEINWLNIAFVLNHIHLEDLTPEQLQNLLSTNPDPIAIRQIWESLSTEEKREYGSYVIQNRNCPGDIAYEVVESYRDTEQFHEILSAAALVKDLSLEHVQEYMQYAFDNIDLDDSEDLLQLAILSFGIRTDLPSELRDSYFDYAGLNPDNEIIRFGMMPILMTPGHNPNTYRGALQYLHNSPVGQRDDFCDRIGRIINRNSDIPADLISEVCP
jgi:hypothetical protein